MENYDLFGDDLGSGMLDSLAELGSDNFGTTASQQQQSNSSQRLGPSTEGMMQNFGNPPPSYTQIGQGLDQSANKMNPNPGYPDYSAQYAQYAAVGQAGLGSYGAPPSAQTPSRPMPGYPPYHQSPSGPSPNIHYQDYSVQSSGMMRPTPREGTLVPPPSQPLVPPSTRMPGPGGVPSHIQQQQQQFPGYRGPSQDLYAQQVHRWNEQQQSYAGSVPHHYPPNAASSYRQPHAYTPNIPRPPQQQQQQSVSSQSQQQQPSQQTGPHSMSPYMTRPQVPASVMPQGYPQMYGTSAQQYPDYHTSSSRVSNVPPPTTPTYGSSHHPQQYASIPSQHPQYGSQYGQYYPGQGQASSGLSSGGPQTPVNGPMSSSYPTGYGSSGVPHGSPSVPNGSPGYRAPGPSYAQLPQLSPRQPTPSPRPPAPSPRPSAPSTPTIPMSPAQSMSSQQQSMAGVIPPPSGHSSISSLQQLEQMVMPHVANKNSPSPKPHLTSSGVLSPMSGPKTPMSPGMIGPKTPMSPTQWQTPPMSGRSSNKQQQQCYPQHIQQPNASPGSLHSHLPGSVSHSPLNSSHASLDASLGGNSSRCQDSSDLDHLTSTLDTSAPEATNQDELVKPSPPAFHTSDLNSINSASTPLPPPEPSGGGSSNMSSLNENSNEALNNLMSQSSASGGGAGTGGITGHPPEENSRFSHQNQATNSNNTTESPTLESENTNLGNLANNLETSQMSNSSSVDSSSHQQQGSSTPMNNSKSAVVSNTHGGTSSGPGSNSSSHSHNTDFGGHQQPIGVNAHGPLSSLSTSGSSSPLPSMLGANLNHQQAGLSMSPMGMGSGGHLQPGTSTMMGYGPQGAGPHQSHQAGSYGSNGPMSSGANRNMTPSPMPNQGQPSGPPHQYPVFSQSANAGGADMQGPAQQGYYHSATGYPSSPYQPGGVHPGMRAPGQHPMPMGHGPMSSQLPPEALQYEIHQLQGQLQHLYSTPPTQQTQMQIAELQDRLRGLQQQASRGPYPGMGHPPMGPQHGVPPIYGQSHPGHGMDMGMDFPPEGPDDFPPKAKKKKERKPKEPKGTGKGKGKGKKEPPMPDFDLMGQPPPPAFGVPPMQMSHEIYDFQDIPPEIPEKKPKKPRKPRESKSPKEKKAKEPKPVKEKPPKKSRSKKKLPIEESPLSFQPPPDSFSMDSSSLLIKPEDTYESDQKNGIGAAGITAAEGGLTAQIPTGISGDGDTSTQDGNLLNIIDPGSPVIAPVDAMSTDPFPEEQPEMMSPQKSPKKKSKPKMKSSSLSKKRPTKTTLIASLAAKKKKKKKGSDSEGCSDLDATPPPSPPPEEDHTNVRHESHRGFGLEVDDDDDDHTKRRSGRHSNRKKYIEDVLACLSDEDLIVPPPPQKQQSASPTKSIEPTTPRPAGSETPGNTTVLTPGNVTPIASSSTPTPLCTADDSSSQGPTKPNFVFVNPAEEDTMIIQHILSCRMGKRDIVAESTDDEEDVEEEKKEIPKPEAEVEESEIKNKIEIKAEEGAEPQAEIKAEPIDDEAESEEPIPKSEESEEPVKTEESEKMDEEKEKETKVKVEPVPVVPKPVKKKRERILETVQVEEYYVKYKNFSYLHCEWKTEEELNKGDKRAVPKIRRFKQKMNQRDVFEFLEEDPFNPEYIEVDRILDKSEVRDPATGNITKNYLVKWRALPYDECTWELADDIDPEKLKQFHHFYNPPPKDQWKPKRRPKAADWTKLEESPVYKNSNTLRAYQLEGLNWLSFSWYNGRNCILADEMGLGKTIQSLTFVESVHRLGIRGPFLIIAPLSTVPNWQREFETWTDLNVVVYHGSVPSRNMIQEYELFYRHPDNPQMNIKDVYKFNVMITTFEIVLTDVLDLKDFPWRLCIIDEAHRLKNKNCKLLEGLRLLNLEHRVLLSGTPLQNNINELFSLLNFLEPAQFSSDENFKKEFGELTTETQVQKLQALLKPMMLRRLKEDVEKSIAPKEETIVEVELTNMQKKYYRGILEKNFSFLSKGTSAANIPNLMNTMMELRKCCIHPYLLNGAEEEIQRDYRIVHGGPDDNDLYYKALVSSSGKMVLVDKLLPKLKANGHRVLIFSQMVRCLDILEDYLIYMKYPFERIDGRIRGPFRQAAIDRFSKPDSDRFVFLLCTKAGGLGINLTAADTVIIYDSDWNPQNDLQAQARCHRIGQAKMVKVYRLICRSTYEREMFDRASLKLGLDKAVLQSMNTSQGSSGKGFDTSANKQLSKKEVEDLLKKGAYGALMDEDNAGDKFCEEDIDCILSRRTQVITLETGEKGSTFSKASFASTGIREDINLDDPDFWTKWAKKAEIEMDEMGQKNELVIHEPRRRTQIKRYGHDEAVMEISELSSTSDSDEDGNIGERTRGRGGKRGRGKRQRSRRGLDDDFHVDDGVVEYGRWSRSECYKIEKGLLTFGWARWKDILNFGQFRIGWGERDIEDCARVIVSFAYHYHPYADGIPSTQALVHCVNNFRGDEKVRSFVQDLIFPGDGAGKVTRSHLGLANPVSRGGRKSRKKGREGNNQSPEPPVEWLKDEKFDPDLHLDNNYKKHIGKHSNKVLLRIRMLYYIKQEIIAEYSSKIAANAPISEIQIIPPSLTVDSGPVPWWDRDADTALLIGTYKHGYERYNMMRMDPNLCYLARCGPPDGSAVLAEISPEVNEEDMDKPGGDDEDEESCLDSASEKQPPSVGSTATAADTTESGKFLWPSGTDINTRLRKLITAFQRNFKKEEVRNAQKAKRQERKEKIDQIVREREKQKLEVYQKRWSKKEEADFFRTVSSYGVQYNRKEKRYDWSKFRAISRLDKKFDETLTEYYRAFYAMCKRISGKKLTEEEDLIQVPVEPVTEERARRTLERIDLLNKIREEIIYHPQLDEKLKLCQGSLDMPDWWIHGRHDKDLLLGAARHGLGRTDVFYLNDPDLSFREILRRHIAGEPLVDPTDKAKKSDKKSKSEGGKRDMVDIEIKDIKQERADQKRQKEADEAAENEAKEKEIADRKEAAENEEKEKDRNDDKMEDESHKRTLENSLEETDQELIIKKEPMENAEDDSKELRQFSIEGDEKMQTDEERQETKPEAEDLKIKAEKVEGKSDRDEQEPSSKRRKLNQESAKSPADYSNKGKRDDEESTKSSGSELNEVQVEIKDEFKITIKLPAEKMKKVEVQVKGSPKFSVPEPPAPQPTTIHFPQDEITLQQMKLLLNPENLSGDNLEALGNLMNQMNPIRWPRDRAVQIRLEHVVHAVEKGEWPVSRFFTSAGLADMFEYTPQGTPDAATPARDTPTPISECSDLAPPEDLIMTLPPAAPAPAPTTAPGRRGRRRRIAIDVETERAKLQALLNHGLHNSNLLPQMQRLNSLRGNNNSNNTNNQNQSSQQQQPMDKEDSSEGEAPPPPTNRNAHSKFQPPPAHQHHSNITSSLLRSSHQKQQQQTQQQRQSPSPRFSPQLQQQQQQSQGSTLDLSFKPTDRNSIAAAAMSALSSLSSVTVTPVTLQSPSSNNNNNNNSALDLSSTRVSNSRRERERGGRDSGRATPQMVMMPEKRRDPTPEPSPTERERPKQSKLEDMLDKLRKRTLGDEAETAPLPVEKEKRRKKLDEIVLGLSASKGHSSSSMFSPPAVRGTRGSSPASSGASTNRLQSPPMTISAAASAAAAAHHQNAKDIATSQANMFNNSLLSATLSLFNSAAGKEFSRQLAGQAGSTSINKGKEGLQRANLPGPSPLAEMPKCDFSRLAELAVPKFDLFSQDAKVNKWLAEHANLTPERPVSPELLDGRRRRRPRVDPMLLDWNKLSGDENVTVINRITGKKITGPKAPQLKHLGHWLSENPAFDVDPRWSDLVREKGNLSSDLQRRVPGGGGSGGGGGGPGVEKKKGPGRPPMLSTQPQINTSTANTASSIPTSSANAYSSLGAFSSIPGLSGLNPNLLASLPLGSLDPKNPLFMPFGGLGSLGGLGNLGSLGSLGSLGNLSSLGLSSSLFGFGFPGMEMGEKPSKESGHSTGGSGAQQSSSSSKKEEKKQKGNSSSSSAALASQNMLSSALPFLFPNPGLMYNPLGLGSFPLGGMNPSSFGSMGSSTMPNGMGGAMGSSSGGGGGSGKKGGKASAASAASLSMAGLAGLNIPSLLKKEGQMEKGNQRGKHSPAAAATTITQPQPGPSQATPTPVLPPQNPEDSDDESMKSLMGNHADDLPDEDSPSENAERIVLKESKELEKELAQQKMETRRERRVRDRSSLLVDAPRGGLTAAERQLLMVKKKERLAKEDSHPTRESGRTTRRSAAAASRSRLEDAVSKMRNSDQSGDN